MKTGKVGVKIGVGSYSPFYSITTVLNHNDADRIILLPEDQMNWHLNMMLRFKDSQKELRRLLNKVETLK